MATSTTNYGLVKPAGSENVQISVINTNMDTIDTELKRVDDEVQTETAPLSKVLGGIRRTSDDGSTSGTTEKLTLTAPGLALEANKTFLVTYYAIMGGTTNDDLFLHRIREDSLTGTVMITVGTTQVKTAGGLQIEVCQAFYITSSSVASKVFVGTLTRNAGTGTANIRSGSYITVTRIGTNTLLSTV